MIIDYSQIQQLAENNLELKVTQQWVASSQAKIKSVGSHFIPEVSLYAKFENWYFCQYESV
jgi:outer membrane protein TolC